MLYPGSAKPLYEQLKDYIKQAISSGEYKQGQALPSERQLMENLRVSRITVRQAIGELVNEGVLYRQHGKGTFVAQKRILRPLASLLGIAEMLNLQGIEADMKVIKKCITKADTVIARELGLNTGDNVMMIKRLISTGDEPLLINFNYLSPQVGMVLDNVDLTQDPIFSQLELYGYKISEGFQRITASKATGEEARYLQCENNSPVLIIKNTTFVDSGRPILYSSAIFRGDRYEVNITLKRNPSY
ncbi:GntR family transcriptional regulator [Petroclostridium sp. X23]|uniref:GntR family transcriptional regulator n=1 Tax=Petroclostridium sp. X23 TaxID=3045146 RepID=UPI0024ADE11A|nr:GntR family transcriptional regulator [Petroclostridium sp. X23]WHH61020.1 GntR family transcriptional regulator [Petroclostridium sp. X23]